MKIKSEIVTQVSGSIGGVTYSHGRSGLERKARLNRSDGGSNQQQKVRSTFAQLAYEWANTLTEPQRTAWSSYAQLTPTTGRFGDTLILTGAQMFTRCNAIRLATGLSLLTQAPTTPGLTEVGDFTNLISKGANHITVKWNALAAWMTEPGAAMTVQTTRFESQGVKNARSPMRQLATIIAPVTPGPPLRDYTENAFGQSPAAAPLGLKMALRLVAIRANGQVSNVHQETLVVGP